MELPQINNSVTSNINLNNANNVQQTNRVEEVSETTSSSVEVSSNTVDENNFVSNVNKAINNISITSSIASMIQNQVKVIDTIQDKISTVTDGTSTKDNIQPNIAQLISKFNSSAGTVNDKISTLDDLNGDSTTYFDGSAGAVPLNIDMLNNTTATKRSELSSTLNKVQEINESFKEMAQSIISSEIKNTQEASPFKEINFGKESADFSSTNMSNIVGSVASSQANAMQAQNIRLLS